MKTFSIYIYLILLIVSPALYANALKNIPTSELGQKYELTGSLHFPVGKVIAIEGQIVQDQNEIKQFCVQKIKGRVLPQHICLPIVPNYSFREDWRSLNPETRQSYELLGYETGSFGLVSTKDVNQPELKFQSHFEVFKIKKIKPIVIGGLLPTAVFPKRPGDIPVGELGMKYTLIGKLGIPLGNRVTVQGNIIEGPSKGYENGPNLKIQKINGMPVSEAIRILIEPNWPGWDKDANDQIKINERQKLIGKTCEIIGYETGGYVGVPDGNLLGLNVQASRFYFREVLIACKIRQIETQN